jgi:hypothetical protein
MFFSCECYVLSGKRFLRRADLSSRGVLPIVVRPVWYRNLKSEEAVSRVGPQRHTIIIIIMIIRRLVPSICVRLVPSRLYVCVYYRTCEWLSESHFFAMVNFVKASLQLHYLNTHFIFITYLYHTSPTCFGVSHTIFRKNWRIPYSKPSAFTLLLSTVHWLSHNMKDTTFLVYSIVANLKNLCFCRSCWTTLLRWLWAVYIWCFCSC